MSQNHATGTIYEASAPGRLDVMGGIADYSGSLVLQMPIREETRVKITLRDDFHCTIQSDTQAGERLKVSVDYRAFLRDGLVNYDFAQQQFKKNPREAWIAYVIGCVLVVQQEKHIEFKGADILIQSEVPLGKGVSSSASLEVATMKALAKAYRLSFMGTELSRLAQRAENFIVGAPCGLMDQLTSFFGAPRNLLPIVCQPDKIMEPISLPSDILFMGLDSGIRHSVGGSSYADVRCSSFMGYSIIAQSVGVSREEIQKAIRSGDHSQLPYGGYLCNIPVSEFETRFKQLLPVSMDGREFLSRHTRTIDSVTSVKEQTRYSVYECTAHPIFENERVHRFMEDLHSVHHLNDQAAKEIIIKKMGELMVRSHESYSRCGLGSSRTDEIVNLAMEKWDAGIAGAKITGGGSGGTVCLLAVGEKGKEAVNELHAWMERKYKTTLALF
jgi:L-arabinokinase